MNLLFFHGWSYDAEFFTDLADTIAVKNSLFYNRGYYAPKNCPELHKDIENIAITHSMGLYFLFADYDADQFAKIIIINGFSDFSQMVSRRALRRMMDGLGQNPQKILQDFSENAGDIRRSIPDLDKDSCLKLQKDLEILQNHTINQNIDAYKGQIFHIHAENDKIAPIDKSNINAFETYYVPEQNHVFSFHKDKKLINMLKKWMWT
ncbi:MAG: hypothetical protein AAF621_08320 [Pseudomonadota bacterium]